MRKYDGNTGRYIYIPDEVIAPPSKEAEPMPAPEWKEEARPVVQSSNKKTAPPPNQFGSGLQRFLSNVFAQGFEMEDLLLFAILFLMYQETKDKELLIIMGGMFLL